MTQGARNLSCQIPYLPSLTWQPEYLGQVLKKCPVVAGPSYH